jgi:hypothetical protein
MISLPFLNGPEHLNKDQHGLLFRVLNDRSSSLQSQTQRPHLLFNLKDPKIFL